MREDKTGALQTHIWTKEESADRLSHLHSHAPQGVVDHATRGVMYGMYHSFNWLTGSKVGLRRGPVPFAPTSGRPPGAHAAVAVLGAAKHEGAPCGPLPSTGACRERCAVCGCRRR